jgi:hypothetical protein
MAFRSAGVSVAAFGISRSMMYLGIGLSDRRWGDSVGGNVT